jgi:hypothetical protein
MYRPCYLDAQAAAARRIERPVLNDPTRPDRLGNGLSRQH